MILRGWGLCMCLPFCHFRMIDTLRTHGGMRLVKQTRTFTSAYSERAKISRALPHAHKHVMRFSSSRRGAKSGGHRRGGGRSHRLHPRVYRASWLQVILRKAGAGGVMSIHTRLHTKHAVRDHHLIAAAAAAVTAAVVVVVRESSSQSCGMILSVQQQQHQRHQQDGATM